jgi:tetratricopeptide (TPR) repeat protein
VTAGREDEAVGVGAKAIRELNKPELKDLLNKTLGVLFRKTILNMLAQGKKYDALAFYQDRIKILPEIAFQTDPDYILQLSRAAADLGLGALAEQLGEVHTEAEKKLKGRTRELASDESELEQKLAEAEKGFTEAKALWIHSGAKAEVKIRELLASVPEESKFSYERELILGLLDDKTAKPTNALGHAVRAQMLRPSSSGPNAPSIISNEEDARVAYWLAGLQWKTDKLDAALETYQRLEKRKKTDASGPTVAEVLGLPPVPANEALIMDEAEIYGKQGKWGDAAASYSRLLKAGQGKNQVLYEYARALEKSGDEDAAQDALKKIAEGKENDFWKKLAVQALADFESKKQVSK